MSARPRILVPVDEPIGGAMSAVGIRQLEIGKALVPHCDVTFACRADGNDVPPGATVVHWRGRDDLRRLLGSHDVLYTLGLIHDQFMDVVRSGIRVVLDLYTPLAFEMLESWPELPTRLLHSLHRRAVRWTIAQLALADFVVCASEPQRDLWLGTMNATGILDAATARANPDCRQLIDVVPFGLPEHPPVAAGHPIRDRLPAITADDFVLLWSSKILAWQDPATLLRAMKLLEAAAPAVKLVFMGVGDPPAPGERRWFDPVALRTRQAFDLAEQLELRDRSVFFVTERIPYRSVGAWYLDADAGVATYPASLETHFCVGSRLLDFVWAGLPLVVSGDDLQHRFVEGQGLGRAVSPGDPEQLAAAIRDVQGRVQANAVNQSAFAAARDRLRWNALAAPVVRYCTSAAAGGRKGHGGAWRARTAHVEFVLRSLACRAQRALFGLGRPQ